VLEVNGARRRAPRAIAEQPRRVRDLCSVA